MAPTIAMPQLVTAVVPAIPSVSPRDVTLPQHVQCPVTAKIQLFKLNVLVLNCNQDVNNTLNASNYENK